MHNLISYNQLAYWKQTESDIRESPNDIVAEYFECLTECDEDTQSCRRMCRSILSS